MASVSVVEHGNGDVSIGVEIDGTYVPFSTVSAARIAHLQDRAASLNARLADEGDEAAQDAHGQLPTTVTGARSSAKDKEGK